MERKQLLGAVFDEIEHHFSLFRLERNAYLALAAVAGLCLLVAIAALALGRAGNPAIAVAVLGGAGLVALAAARSTAFFHGALAQVEDVVKRYSKLSEPELVSSVEALKRRSELSVTLVAIGAAAVAGSVVFAFAGAARMERVVESAREDAARARADAARWQDSVAGAQRAYAELRASVAAAYGAHVTARHQVLEVRAAARKLERPTPGASHAFTLTLHGPAEAMAAIRAVRYRMGDAGGQWLSGEAARAFEARWQGAGCLSRIDITLEILDGSTESIVFDQCRSLGAGWAPAWGS
jgi:hypothetical protein